MFCQEHLGQEPLEHAGHWVCLGPRRKKRNVLLRFYIFRSSFFSLDRMLIEVMQWMAERHGESEGRINRSEVSKHSHEAGWRQKTKKSLKYLAQYIPQASPL